MTENPSPLEKMGIGFRSYIARRKAFDSLHMSGHGIPDYGYSADYELRKKLDSIPHLYSIAEKICATYTSRHTQEINRQGIAASPSQFPEIYRIGCDCAKTLGIGVPNIYIINDINLQAYTYSVDDTEPIVVLSSGLAERFTEGELRHIIGHECGHVHNRHGVYNTLVSIIAQIGLGAASSGIASHLAGLLTQTTLLALNAWSRASEVTADRAGMICCENKEDCYTSLAKLAYGGMLGEHKIDFNELRKQLEMQQSNITQLSEVIDVGHTHPTIIRRIFASMEFSECGVLYSWHPELREHGQITRSKEETDERCRSIVSAFAGKEG